MGYTHYSSGRQGILLCYENDKGRDDHAEGMRLHPSEVGWQSFLMATNEDRVSSTKLRAIIQHCIVNTPTKKVIYEVARSSACTRSGPDGYLEYTELDNGFFAILGSDLGEATSANGTLPKIFLKALGMHVCHCADCDSEYHEAMERKAKEEVEEAYNSSQLKDE